MFKARPFSKLEYNYDIIRELEMDDIHASKLTWQIENPIFNMEYIFFEGPFSSQPC